MRIVQTFYDGSIRSSAILQTQSELRDALIRGTEDFYDIARTTLVQTAVHVMTIGAVIMRMRDEPDFEPRVADLVRQASDVGLPEVAAGLLAHAKRFTSVGESFPKQSPSPSDLTRTLASEASVYQL